MTKGCRPEWKKKFSRRGSRLCWIPLTLALSFGCVSAPPRDTQDTGAAEAPAGDGTAAGNDFIARELEVLERSRRLLLKGTPADLQETLRILRDSVAGASEKGEEFRYIAYKLLRTLYPLLEPGEVVAAPPTGGVGRYFTQIGEGRYGGLTMEGAPAVEELLRGCALYLLPPEAVPMGAVTALERAQQSSPDSPLIHFLQGYRAFLLERLADAEGGFRAALQGDSGLYPAREYLCRTLLALNRPAEAEPLALQLMEQFPSVAAYRYLAALSLFEQGRFQRASDFIIEALKREPLDRNYLLLRARVLFAQGQLVQAERFLTMALREGADNPDVLLLQARLLMEEQRFTEARQLLSRGQERFPGDPRPARLYAEVLLRIGDTEEGTRILQRDLEKNPGDFDNLLLLLESAWGEEDWSRAEGYLQRLLEIEPGYELQLRLCRLRENQGDYAALIEESRKLWNDEPQRGEAGLCLVRGLIAENRRLEAGRIIERILDKVDNATLRSRAYYQRSRIARSDGEKLSALHNALLENLKNQEALVAMAEYYETRGELKRALRYWKQAAALSQDDASWQQRIDALEEKL